MNANQTLILPHEISRYAPADVHFDVSKVAQHTLMKEEKLFRDCFGKEFYETLEAALTPVTDYTTFKLGTNYAVNALVVWDDNRMYKCTVLTTGNELPNDTVHWEAVDKFTNVDYTYLWERYMARIIAWHVVYTAVMGASVNATNIGLQRKEAEGSRPASLKEIVVWKNELIGDATNLIEIMEAYILENEEKYPKYRAVLESCEDCTSKNTRRKFHGFNAVAPEE